MDDGGGGVEPWKKYSQFEGGRAVMYVCICVFIYFCIYVFTYVLCLFVVNETAYPTSIN